MIRIQKLDAKAVIRKNPRMYTGADSISGGSLLKLLVEDVKLVVGDCVTCGEEGGIFYLKSEQDWLFGLSESEIESIFSRFVSRPDGAVNSFRKEVLLGAFASSIATKSADQLAVVIQDHDDKGRSLVDFLSRDSIGGRALAFRLAEPERSTQ